MSADELQIHWYGEFGWNITQAMKIVADRQPEPQDITRWLAELPRVTINESHWPTVDLAQPLIIVPMYGTDDVRLIDGWHRVRRAQAEGINTLPVHMLSRTEERMIRGYGGDRPA